MAKNNPTAKQAAARARFARNAKRAARLGRGKTAAQRARIRSEVFGGSKRNSSKRASSKPNSSKRKPVARSKNGQLLSGRKKAPNKKPSRKKSNAGGLRVGAKLALNGSRRRRGSTRRNAEERSAATPIAVRHHYRSGPPGYATPHRRAEARGQQRLSSDWIENSRRNVRRGARRRNQSGVEALHQEFLGRPSTDTFTAAVPEGAPKDLAMLGELVLIKTNNETLVFEEGEAALCADEERRLWIATDTVVDPYEDIGEISRIEYQATKEHLGDEPETIYFHKMGEEGGERPKLIADGDGSLVIAGGEYSISSDGLIN